MDAGVLWLHAILINARPDITRGLHWRFGLAQTKTAPRVHAVSRLAAARLSGGMPQEQLFSKRCSTCILRADFGIEHGVNSAAKAHQSKNDHLLIDKFDLYCA